MKKDFIDFLDNAIQENKGVRLHIIRPELEEIGSDDVKRKSYQVVMTRNVTAQGLKEERDNIINDYDENMNLVTDRYFRVSSWETF